MAMNLSTIVSKIVALLSCILVVGCSTIIIPTPATGLEEREFIAVLTYVDGDVYIERAMTTHRPPGMAAQVPPQQPASPYDELENDDVLVVEPGSAATVVCYTDQTYQVNQGSGGGSGSGGGGGSRETVTPQRCNAGQQLPRGSAEGVRPRNGRFRRNHGSRAVQGRPRDREDDYGRIPVILAPRNTSLLNLEPSLVWAEVSDAFEYELNPR